MKTHKAPIGNLIAKIRCLPEEQVDEVMEFVDSIRERQRHNQSATEHKPFRFPVISVGQWPDDLPLNRAEMYGDDGR